MNIMLCTHTSFLFLHYLFIFIFIPIRRENGEKIPTERASKIRGKKNNKTGGVDPTDCHDDSFYRA